MRVRPLIQVEDLGGIEDMRLQFECKRAQILSRASPVKRKDFSCLEDLENCCKSEQATVKDTMVCIAPR